MRNRALVVWILVIVAMSLLAGCGGGGSNNSSNATLTALSITPANPSIAKGTSQQFTATGTYSDNTTKDLTTFVNWSSAGQSVATISDAGLTTTADTGATTIEAKDPSTGISGSTNLTVTAAQLVSIEITPINPSIAKGTTKQLSATGVFSDGTTQDLTAQVTWSSSNTGLAIIDSAGLATAVNTGSDTILAASGSISGSTTLTVTAATLTSISITPINPSIAKGTTKQFTATGTFSDGTTQDLTTQATWSSSNTGVATINNNGLATSVATGSSTVTATSGTIAESTTLTVTAATLTAISVTPINPSIAKGTTQQFTATGTYTDNTTQNLTTSVTWSSSNTVAATISNAAGSNGLASSVAVGTATITATDPSTSISGSTALTVANTTPMANAGAAQNVVTGTLVTLDGSGSNDANGDTITYSWSITSKPSGSSAVLSEQTNVKPTFTPDVDGSYVFNLVVNDGMVNSDASTVTVTASVPKLLNIGYVARNGLTVTLTSFTFIDNGSYYKYTANYTQKNNTSTPIDEGQLKLYFTNSTAQPQYGFFNKLYPGDSQSRSYTFNVLYTENPWRLEYDHDNFFASNPVTGSIQWIIPIPN